MAAQVLIVEDHPLVAEATGDLIAAAPFHVQTTLASTAAQTIRLLEGDQERWYRIFLDLDVPGAYGLSLAKDITDRGLAERTCVVSAFDSDDYIGKIRRWGFQGYIVKTMPFQEFRLAILGILEGKPAFRDDATVATQVAARLTRRQAELLQLIRRGLSSRQIASELSLAEGTVNNHVAAILQVLEADSRAHAVSRAIELGLLDTAARPSHVQQPALRRVLHD